MFALLGYILHELCYMHKPLKLTFVKITEALKPQNKMFKILLIRKAKLTNTLHTDRGSVFSSL
jgi:hypothetical protein